MTFKITHQNFNVFDMERSLKFYEQALDLHVIRTREAPDGSFRICYVGNEDNDFCIELTWTKEYDRPYDLGDAEFHLGLVVDDYAAAHARHEAMGCIAFENEKMGLYFITDPDGYWIEILPAKR